MRYLCEGATKKYKRFVNCNQGVNLVFIFKVSLLKIIIQKFINSAWKIVELK